MLLLEISHVLKPDALDQQIISSKITWNGQLELELSSNLRWTSSNRLIGLLRDIAVEYTIQVHNEVPMGLNSWTYAYCLISQSSMKLEIPFFQGHWNTKCQPWLKEGTHKQELDPNYVCNKATISRNVGITTFGPTFGRPRYSLYC